LTLRQGVLFSVTLDLIKIVIAVVLLCIQIGEGDDSTAVSVVDLRTQMIKAPKKLGHQKGRHGENGTGMSNLQVIVIFIGDVVRYSVVMVIGLIMLWKKWKAMYVGTYFWVKLIQSILNVFSALLMVTLTQLPFTDMILSVVSFALDQYFCIVIYSKWQENKEIELLML